MDTVERPQVDRPVPKHVNPRSAVNELQKELLLAAMENPYNPAEIVLYRIPGSHEGEVKIGGKRIFGDEAVLAALDLLVPGWITETEEDCFRLTPAGTRIANSLLRADSAATLQV